MSKQPSIVRLHFYQGEKVRVRTDFHPQSIFHPLNGKTAKVEAESTVRPGYYHCRFVGRLPEFGPVENPLCLIPWHCLELAE